MMLRIWGIFFVPSLTDRLQRDCNYSISQVLLKFQDSSNDGGDYVVFFLGFLYVFRLIFRHNLILIL